MRDGKYLVETRGLSKTFKASGGGLLHAVEDVDLGIGRGRTLGVVGESGCGKSTLGRCVLRLQEPSSGDVLFGGESILKYRRRRMKELHRDMQMIFQDPYGCLDPRMPVFELIAEPLRELSGRRISPRELEERVLDIMEQCGLPRRCAESYPHELDGGRRQRVGLARAMVVDPKFIVCDEPVSALDVSIQAQILNLLMDMQERRGLTYMFITPRPVRRPAHKRRDHRHVHGPGGGAGGAGRALQKPAAPLYGAAVRHTHDGPEPQGQAEAAAGRRGVLARGPAAGLPLRAALPARRAGLRRGLRPARALARAPLPLCQAGMNNYSHQEANTLYREHEYYLRRAIEVSREARRT